MRHRLAAVLCLVTALLPLSAAAQVRSTIIGRGVKRYPIAVPSLDGGISSGGTTMITNTTRIARFNRWKRTVEWNWNSR